MSRSVDRAEYPLRLRLLIAGAVALAIPVAAGAAVSIALEPAGAEEGLAVLLFIGLALLAELKPVPLEEDNLSSVSLAFVFILSGAILFGWEDGVLIAALSALLAQVLERKPLSRIAFNTAVYVLSAFAAALPALAVGGGVQQDAVSITVNSVNDGPVNTVPGAQSVNEDTALSIGGISVNDVDGNLSTTQLTVTNGTVSGFTATSGNRCTYASDFATEQPTRSEPTSPGPCVTAMPSRSGRRTRASASAFSTTGTMTSR